MKPILLVCLVLAGCNDFDASKHLTCTTAEREAMLTDFKFCQDKFGPNLNGMCEDESIARNCTKLNTAGRIWAIDNDKEVLNLPYQQSYSEMKAALPAEAIPQDKQ